MSAPLNVTSTSLIPCCGMSNGLITLDITGGYPPYTIQWKRNGFSFSTNQNLINLSDGTYSYLVTDSNPLTPVTESGDVVLTCNPIVDNPTITPPTCSGNNGTIALAPSGGTPTYTYLWSTGDTGSSITVSAGNYYVTITDSNGCTASFGYTMPATAAPALEIAQQQVGDDIVLTALFNCTGGTVVWNTGETTTSIVGTIGQDYTVTLTCGSGCTATASTSIITSLDRYWCCLAEEMSFYSDAVLSGAKPCKCQDNNTLILINLIDIYSRFATTCLTDEQKNAITSKLNELCDCGC